VQEGDVELGPGVRIDRYEIVRSVATGGMGRVWLGRFGGKHGFEKQVAIKTILPELAVDQQFRTMLLDEARICSRLEHANIAQILDVGEHGKLPYIVFEWVDGASLEQLCRVAEDRGQPVALGPLLRVMADVCSGLHAAHELTDEEGHPLKVVHRDVTPNNIIVSRKGFAKLIDFGVAKARDRMAGETRSGIVKGTPQYMAPEQARGDKVDRRADVWAVGAVLHRALRGAPPFKDRFELEAFIRRRKELDPLPDDVPEDVRSIVMMAMHRDPAERFVTADELRFALERARSKNDTRRSIADLFPAGESTPAGRAMSELPTAAEDIALARTFTALPGETSDKAPKVVTSNETSSVAESAKPASPRRSTSDRPMRDPARDAVTSASERPAAPRSARAGASAQLKLAFAVALVVAALAVAALVWSLKSS
jgi:serine/threonine-protein kinase